MQVLNSLPFLYPVINLDFSKGVITPEIKYSGAASYFQNSSNKLGVSALNQPVPSYRKGRSRSGLYMGRGSTNLLTKSSNSLVAAQNGWTNNSTTTVVDSTQSPIAGGDSIKLSLPYTGSHAQLIGPTPAHPLNTEMVASCFVKAGNVDWFGIQIDSNYGSAIDYSYTSFKINKSDYYPLNAWAGAGMEAIGDDWFRVWVSRRFVTQSASQTTPFLRFYPGVTSAQVAGQYVYMAYPQLETGPVPGAPIITSGSQVSISEPTATIDFSSSKITALFRIRELTPVIPKTQQVLASFGDATNGIVICRGADESNTDATKKDQIYYHYIVGGTLRYSAKVFLARSLVKGSVYGLSIDPVAGKISIVGDTTATFTESWPIIQFGNLTLGKAFNAAVGAPTCGWTGDIERVVVYREAVSLENLVALCKALKDE